MSTKINLRSVRVEYVKGKYSYKQLLNNFKDSEDIKVMFSGNISSIKRTINLDNLYEDERSFGRLDKVSRDTLKGLQMNLNNSKVIESKGVTHIIVYECLNK